ncbi:MAG: tetratricopeptide repeat protein [Alphaproteobacteria bacterium]|nr:MAG: tetratricopeptide repeat protein [Alphaproteobacteria bacterium]
MALVFNFIFAIVISINSFVLAASSQDINKMETAETLLKKGKAFLAKKKYQEAAKTFAKIEEEFPDFDDLNEAILLTAQSFLLDKSYVKAIEFAELLKTIAPNYQVNTVNDILVTAYYHTINNPGRENKNLHMILNLSNQDKTKHSKIRQMVVDILAYESFDKAICYTQQGNYFVALMYYGEVIQKNKESSLVPEAYFRCAEIFNFLGLTEDKNRIVKILALSYPESKWYYESTKLQG